MGFANLSINERAIDRFSGNLDKAINYLFEYQDEEVNNIKPANIKGGDIINPKIVTQ
jgi:hypothetical protein